MPRSETWCCISNFFPVVAHIHFWVGEGGESSKKQRYTFMYSYTVSNDILSVKGPKG